MLSGLFPAGTAEAGSASRKWDLSGDQAYPFADNADIGIYRFTHPRHLINKRNFSGQKVLPAYLINLSVFPAVIIVFIPGGRYKPATFLLPLQTKLRQLSWRVARNPRHQSLPAGTRVGNHGNVGGKFMFLQICR